MTARVAQADLETGDAGRAGALRATASREGDTSSPKLATFTGILPAAGIGSRLGRFRYPKELLPVVYVHDADRLQARPMPVAEYSLQAMRMAGVDRCLVVISDTKTDLLHYFGDGSEISLPLAYLHRAQAKGLADAIDAGYTWIAGANSYTCLALPDTIFRPMTAPTALRERILETGADVVLGVFPTDHPQNLGPVRLDEVGRAIEILEKPALTDLYNTWGVAVWSPRFSDFLHSFLESHPALPGLPGFSVSEVFNAAIIDGYDVRGIFFEDGSFLDVGTAEGIASLLLPADLVGGSLTR